jgi:hypothetical protein
MTYDEECDDLQQRVNNVLLNNDSYLLMLKLIATILVAIYRRMGHI